MKRYLSSVCLFSLLCFLSSVLCITEQQLPDAIHAIISQPQYDRMEWGILIQVQDNSSLNQTYRTIYSQNANQFFTPASNNKVITTVPAYLYLGQDFSIKTALYADSKQGTIQNACLLGRGDPAVTLMQLRNLAQSLQQSGVQTIESLSFDDTYFPSFPSAWEWEDLVSSYGAQPNSLILTQNAVTIQITPNTNGNYKPVSYSFTTGDVDLQCMGVVNKAITIPASDVITQPIQAFYRMGDKNIYLQGQMHPNDPMKSISLAVLQPAERFECAFKYYLNQASISVSSSNIQPCSPPGSWYELGWISSPPLVDTMNYTLQESDNLFTECFLRTLGALYQGLGGHDAQQEGIKAIRTILNVDGVDVSGFVQDDGSGLSRHNLVSPQSLAETLIMIDSQSTGSTYRTFLPVAGESGTLKNRFVGTSAQGIVHAKTGSMSGVNSLSGFVDASDNYPQIVFSILTNFSDQSSSVVRQGIDQIVVLLTQLTES